MANAETGIADLNTQVDTLTAETESGNLSVLNTGALTIGTAGGQSGVTITDAGANDADILVTSTTGGLTVAQAVTNNDGGDVILAAEGTAAADDLAINAATGTNGGNGSLTFYAGDTISIDTGFIADAVGTGTVTALAGTDYNGGTPQNGNAAGAVSMTDTSEIRTGDIQLSILNADSDSAGAIGDVTVEANWDGIATGLANATGAITDALTAETANITASLATLTAAAGIGSADDINVEVAQVNAVNSTSGDVRITEVTVTDGITVTGASTGGNGTVRIESPGAMGVTGAISSAGSGNIELTVTAPTNDITLSAGLDAGTGAVTLDSTSEVRANAGASVTTLGGTVTVSDLLRINDDLTVTTGAGGVGDISLPAGFGTTTDDQHTLTLIAGTGNITISGPSGVNDTEQPAGLTIESATDVHFSGAAATVDTNDLTVTSAAGDVRFDGVVAVDGNIDITTDTPTVTTTAAGTITVTNGDATGDVSTIGANITSAGDMTFDGVGRIDLGANLEATDASAVVNVVNSEVLDEVTTDTADSHTLTLTAGAGAVTIDDNVGPGGTAIGGLDIASAGSVLFSGTAATIDARTLRIGSTSQIGGPSGAVAGTGTVTFEGDVTIANTGADPDVLVDGDGALTIDADFSVAAGGSADFYSADIVITAGNSVAVPTLALYTNDGTTDMNAGTSAAGAWELDDAEIGRLSATAVQTLTVGEATVQAGTVTIRTVSLQAGSSSTTRAVRRPSRATAPT